MLFLLVTESLKVFSREVKGLSLWSLRDPTVSAVTDRAGKGEGKHRGWCGGCVLEMLEDI